MGKGNENTTRNTEQTQPLKAVVGLGVGLGFSFPIGQYPY